MDQGLGIGKSGTKQPPRNDHVPKAQPGSRLNPGPGQKSAGIPVQVKIWNFGRDFFFQIFFLFLLTLANLLKNFRHHSQHQCSLYSGCLWPGTHQVGSSADLFCN